MSIDTPNTTVNPFSRRCFVALAGIGALSLATGTSLTGCTSDVSDAADENIDYADWDAVLEQAAGSTVSWYGYGGNSTRNAWLDTIFAPRLKELYDITLNVVGMNIDDILTQLSGEMQAGLDTGSIDFIWINGENFYSTKNNGYLWGPFCDYLPNFVNYVDETDSEMTVDFGSSTEGYEAPYSKAQMQMWVDGARITDTPTDPDSFLEFCKTYQGQVTYPEPGDFIGTAFISCLIAGVIGRDEFEKLSVLSPEEATLETVKGIIEPGLVYLRSLNPYLWQQGTTFPSNSSTVSTMYADGELVMSMDFTAPQSLVEDGTLPDTTTSFIFDSGTVGNTNFMAITANAPHKAAALVAINEILSPEMQLSIYEELTTLTVLDMDKLSEEQLASFDEVPLKSTQIPLTDLLDCRITEASGPAIPIIEQLWLDEVVGK